MRFGYDAEDRIISWTDRNDSHYSYVYDHLGRVRDEGGADGTLRFTFHYGEPDPATGLKVHTETDALGRSTRYQVNQHAQITAQTDALGNTTRFERDQYDRLLSATDPLDRTTRYTYDAAGDLIAVTRPDGERPLPTTRANSAWPPRSPSRAAASGARPTTSRAPHLAHRSARRRPRTTRYDVRRAPRGSHRRPGQHHHGALQPGRAADRVHRSARRHHTHRTRRLRPHRRRHRSARGHSTRTTWTLEGRPASRTTARRRHRELDLGRRGQSPHPHRPARPDHRLRVHALRDPARPGQPRTAPAPPSPTTRTCNSPAVTDPQGRTWNYSYDAAGRLTGESDFHGRQVAYEYDPADQLTTLIDPLRRRTRYRYDDLGRITARTPTAASPPTPTTRPAACCGPPTPVPTSSAPSTPSATCSPRPSTVAP